MSQSLRSSAFLVVAALFIIGCGPENSSSVRPSASTPSGTAPSAPGAVDVLGTSKSMNGTVHFAIDAVCLGPGEQQQVDFVNSSDQPAGYALWNPVTVDGVLTHQMVVQKSSGVVPVISTPATWPPIADEVLPAGDTVAFTVTGPSEPGTYVLSIPAAGSPAPTLSIVVSDDCSGPQSASIPPTK